MSHAPIEGGTNIPISITVTICRSNPRSRLLNLEPWIGIYQFLRQFRSSTPCSIKHVSICFISARTLRPLAALSRRFSNLSLVYLPCCKLASEIRARPSLVLGPVLAPPCTLQRPSLPGPIYPKTPFYTDGHIVFCYHSKYPKYEVLSYRIFIGVKRGGLLSVIFMEGRATAVTCTLFLCLYY
jgi:hypothetical protein